MQYLFVVEVSVWVGQREQRGQRAQRGQRGQRGQRTLFSSTEEPQNQNAVILPIVAHASFYLTTHVPTLGQNIVG